MRRTTLPLMSRTLVTRVFDLRPPRRLDDRFRFDDLLCERLRRVGGGPPNDMRLALLLLLE